jgi:pimeloyl-ACP methyl ester carboxylesterase
LKAILTIAIALALPYGAFCVARQAVNDLPARIDSGGHLLRLRVEGEESPPTVVLEIGLGGCLEEWAAVQSEVAKFARIAAYDRLGAHHDVPKLTGIDVAHELHKALENAGLRPPYVLVGQSFGGIYIRIFASLYSDEVVGLVLLDPSQEDFIEWMRINHPAQNFKRSDLEGWPEGLGIEATLQELKAVGPLPDVPTNVVSAAKPSTDALVNEVRPEHIASNKRWVESLPRGRHVVSDKTGHGVQVEQPDLVIDLIREVVVKARQSGDNIAESNPGPQRGQP